MAADLTEPGVKRSFAPVGLEPVEPFADRLLYDFTREIVISVEANQGKPVESGEISVEQIPKRAFVTLEDASCGCEVRVVRRIGHGRLCSRALDVCCRPNPSPADKRLC